MWCAKVNLTHLNIFKALFCYPDKFLTSYSSTMQNTTPDMLHVCNICSIHTCMYVMGKIHGKLCMWWSHQSTLMNSLHHRLGFVECPSTFSKTPTDPSKKSYKIFRLIKSLWIRLKRTNFLPLTLLTLRVNFLAQSILLSYLTFCRVVESQKVWGRSKECYKYI